jgi:esterase/lipase/1-acyl-sn-glycerol-3-phosphate acyltransferase
MGQKTYQVTGFAITALRKMLGVRLRVSGTENLVARPTLFVANHFTRVETFLIPYVIFMHARRQVGSLGTPVVFKGLFGRYFEALGGMSTRHPRRNRTIVRELMTGEQDWIIYPEGGLIKNKKTIHRGRLRLTHPERHGPPHTGAAVLALKAEASKRRYLEACAEGDKRRIEYYQESLGLTSPDEVNRDGIVMVPVTLSFYPMRPSRNLVNRLAKFIVHDLDPRIDEELQVEGSILLTGTEVVVHFGAPIEVSEYLSPMLDLARRVAGLFSEESRTDLFMKQQARRLTEACMRSIYANLEINLDHLLCYGLRACERDRIQVDDLRAALFLAADELGHCDGVRLHPALRGGAARLVAGGPSREWDAALKLGLREGVVRREGETIVIDRAALDRDHEFHRVRLEKMIQVIANEVEPIRSAVDAVRRSVNLSTAQLRKRTARVLHEREVEVFERDYADAYDPALSKARELGEPYLLDGRRGNVGVLLCHGYLASPEQVRPLAEHLHARGCSVYAVRLPGHGTAPEQLAAVRWQDWLESASRGLALVRQHGGRIVVGGFSLGGTLALLLAAQHPQAVCGVFSINAPLRLRDPRSPLVGPLARFDGAMRYLGMSRGPFRVSNEDSEDPEINYRVDYVRSLRELKRAARTCRANLPRVTAPVLVLQSDHDPLVDPAAGKILLKRLGSRDKVLSTVPSDRHLVIRGPGSDMVFETIARFIARVTG